ncbi:hypothetical protein OS493_000587 [Desmophyllum pertusum]|uniref:Uncharacterized protein n=1 Tax=Desmophyllum pertusum TaxID=174260 RepID=A0A9X0DE83_9CNID|nr:hypothetical protein OS493_000587 [Desmophyllum pertusum]
MEFCRDACKESREGNSNLCSWCSNNRWILTLEKILEQEQRRRQEEERTYKDFQWDALTESGKVETLRVRELVVYLKEHGLTTIGRKSDKLKAIRFHYYRKNKESVDTDELSSDEDEVESEDEESESEEEDESDNDFCVCGFG